MSTVNAEVEILLVSVGLVWHRERTESTVFEFQLNKFTTVFFLTPDLLPFPRFRKMLVGPYSFD